MKKSSVIVCIGIIAAVITMGAADIKLQKEYNAKNIKEYVLYKALPAFHYIKDDYTGKRDYEWYVCTIHSASEKSGVGINFDAENILRFEVKDDTLFIQKHPNGGLNDIAYGLPVTIFTGSLKGVVARSCWMNIDGKIADSTTVVATRKAQVKFEHINANYIGIDANNTASVSIFATDTVKNINLQMKGSSFFTANNVFVENKHFQLSDSAALKLSGKSLENFGVKNSQ